MDTHKIDLNEAEWPVVHISWGAGEASDASVQQLLDRLVEYTKRGQRFAVILDARQGSGVSASQRKLFAEFLKTHAEALRATMAVALVLSTSLQRGLVTAINWVSPSPMPQTVHATPQAAKKWCAAWLGGAAR